MDKEALLRRIKKVQELATRGEHSEKEAAEKNAETPYEKTQYYRSGAIARKT